MNKLQFAHGIVTASHDVSIRSEALPSYTPNPEDLPGTQDLMVGEEAPADDADGTEDPADDDASGETLVDAEGNPIVPEGEKPAE